MPNNIAVGVDAPLTVLHGVGPETAKKFETLGLRSLRDLLLYFPRRYDNYATMKTINRLEYGEECSVIGAIAEARERRIRNGKMTTLRVVLSDTTGQIEMTFFNQPWLRSQLVAGRQVVVAGRVDQYLGRRILVPTEWEFLDREMLHTARIVPIYSLTQGVTSHNLRKLTAQVVQHWAPKQPDPLPAEMVARAGLLSYGQALAQIHFPDSEASLEAARHRLAFDELLLLQLGVLRQRQEWQSAAGVPLAASEEWLQAYLTTLPFALTGAQGRTLNDIRAELARGVPMN
ncbi:MAG: OB-fold nucleic acid binding domain-containing protein, partial [bacterium]